MNKVNDFLSMFMKLILFVYLGERKSQYENSIDELPVNHDQRQDGELDVQESKRTLCKTL